jgi:DNA-binding SARP family transcriptional activator
MTESASSIPPGSWSLLTLGDLALHRPGGHAAAAALGPGKPLALLTYLHFSPRRTASRDHLTALLWSDMDDERARHALRQTVYALRQLLGDSAIGSDREEIELRLPLACDRDRFLAAMERGDHDEALRLYTGPFFPAFAAPGGSEFERWADTERERCRALFIRSAEILVRRSLDTSRFRQAQQVARRARDESPLAEGGWRLLLEALVAGGDAAAARAEATAFEAVLRAEGRRAEPATLALLRRLAGPETEAVPAGRSGLLSELVGREREFAALLAAWEEARLKRGRHLHLLAPAGLGKTRLIDDLAARLSAQGARVLQIRATQGEREVSYSFAADLARGLSTLSGIMGVAHEAAAVLVGLHPTVSNVLHVTARIIASPGELERQRISALEEALTACSEAGPVAILVDDVHWLDADSYRVLRALVERLRALRLLIVTTSRPAPKRMLESDRTEVIYLEPLSAEGTGALVASLALPPSTTWLQEVAGALHQSTRGSPLLVLETVQLLVEAGVLGLEDGRWTCPDPNALLVRLRTDVALDRRLAGLPQTPTRLLTALAVAGAPLDEAALTEAVGVETPDDLGPAMDLLEARGFTRRSEACIDVAHDEIGRVAVERAGPDLFREANLLVARALAFDLGAAPGALGRAIRHAAAANALGEAGSTWRRYLRLARRAGDHRRARYIARELLGADARPDQVRHLLRVLPWHARLGRAGQVALGGLVLLAAAAPIGWWFRSPQAPPPEAELLLVLGAKHARHFAAPPSLDPDRDLEP